MAGEFVVMLIFMVPIMIIVGLIVAHVFYVKGYNDGRMDRIDEEYTEKIEWRQLIKNAKIVKLDELPVD